MSSLKKTLDSWRIITEEQYSTVESVLRRSGFTLEGKKGGSHFVFRHHLITKYYRKISGYFHEDFAPDGSLVIVQHGNKVKKWYLRRAVDAIEKLAELQELEEDHRRR